MKGESRQIREIFPITSHFIIPIYQRRYSWKKAQCERLFDDIEDACREGRSHFIGCIITVSDGGMGEYLVIDGQQRITTISLLLKAMYDLLKRGEIKTEDSRLADIIRDDFLMVRRGKSDQERIRLNLLNEDKDDYFRLFEDDRTLSEESIIHANYNYFVSRLRSTSLDIENLYDTIQSLQIVSITLEHGDNPQLIFESLNSTGLALTEGDKIRNFILMGLTSNEQVKYYNDYWSKIEKNCGYEDTSGFVRDYLSLKTQKIPNIKAVYQDFRDYWIDCGKTPVEILEDLRSYSHSYRKLIEADTGNKKADAAITGLAHLETTVIRPFAMEVIHLSDEGLISGEEAGQSFSIVEDYIFRRQICALPTNALNKIFATLANDIRKLDGTYDDYSDKLSFVLLKKQGSGKFPSDEEFVSDFKGRNLYGSTVSRVIWYIFSCLENEGTLETKDVWNHLEKGEYSIEHIMPQTLSEKWMEDLGEDWETVHEEWLNRIGNLTVVAAPYNSMFSNNPFTKKRDMEHGFKDSGLRINQFIASKDKWTADELSERTSLLAEKALSIWPGLVSSYQEPEEEKVEISLDDDIDLTGRSLLSASFNGTPVSATVWADFVEQVSKLVYEADPSRLAAITKDASRYNLDSFLYTSSVEHSRKISDSIWLRTDCDTNRKIWFMKRLFSAMSIDEESLVMYVDSSDRTEAGAVTNKRLWAHIIPKLIDATTEAGLPSYQNRNPIASYYLDGFIGTSKMHLVSSFGFRKCKVWAYLYIDGGDKAENLRIFNHFYAHKTEIERAMETSVRWLPPEEKKRRAQIMIEASVPFIADESRWNEVAEVSGALMKKLVTVLRPYVETQIELLAERKKDDA